MIRDIQTNDDGVILDIGGHAFPLLAKHVFIGAGANAFMLDYPQYDYIYHAYVTGQNSYDVKAHCWYLQQWVENGLIGLLLLIGFLGCYVVRSTRIYRKADLKESIRWESSTPATCAAFFLNLVDCLHQFMDIQMGIDPFRQ